MRFINVSALAMGLAGLHPSPRAAQTSPLRHGTLNVTVGQHFIVENRAGGASGTVGANAVAKAAPDGYTLMVSASVHVINPFLYKSVPYDVVSHFNPVSLPSAGPRT